MSSRFSPCSRANEIISSSDGPISSPMTEREAGEAAWREPTMLPDLWLKSIARAEEIGRGEDPGDGGDRRRGDLRGAGDADRFLLLKYANRHGLIAGATGTGKTVTLRTIAERLSQFGVPVFMADVKGDLSGIARAGGDNPRAVERAKQLGIENTRAEPSRRSSGTCSANAAIRSAPPSQRSGRCSWPACSSSMRPRKAC